MRKPERLVAELTPGESRAVEHVLSHLRRESGGQFTRKQLALEGVRVHAARLGVEVPHDDRLDAFRAARKERREKSGAERVIFRSDRLRAVLALRRMTCPRLSRLLRSQWSAQHLRRVISGERAPGAALHKSLRRWLGGAYPYVVGESEIMPATPAKGVRP